MNGGITMPDRESVTSHLQIIHTWAEFARERDLQFFTAKHLEDIAQWADDAIELMKKQEAEIRQLRLAVAIAKGMCNGIKVEGR
jgi:hypothetical protein